MRARASYYPTASCLTCRAVLRVNLLSRHIAAHGDLRDRLQVSHDEQAEMVRLYARGGTLASVALATFWSKTEVRRVLLANGVQLRAHGLGRSRPGISPDEALRRTQLYGRGLSIQEVADVCGVHRSAILATLKREGVRMRPQGVNQRWARRARATAEGAA